MRGHSLVKKKNAAITIRCAIGGVIARGRYPRDLSNDYIDRPIAGYEKKVVWATGVEPVRPRSRGWRPRACCQFRHAHTALRGIGGLPQKTSGSTRNSGLSADALSLLSHGQSVSAGIISG